MTLQQVLEVAVPAARKTKEYVCRRGPRDIRASCDLWRGDELVALVQAPQHVRDDILRLTIAAIGVFDADAAALIFESYAAAVPGNLNDPEVQAAASRQVINPLTGKEWGPGEMQDAAVNHQALEKGWLTECVTIIAANRAGDVRSTHLPYRYAAGRHLVWGEEVSQPQEAVPEGVIVDAIVHAMNTPSISTELPYDPTEGNRAERDAWATEALTAHFGCRVVLLAEAGQKDRVRILREAGFSPA